MQRTNDQQNASSDTNNVKVSSGGIFNASSDKDSTLKVSNISVDETSEVNIVAKGPAKVIAQGVTCQNNSRVTIASGLNPEDAVKMFTMARRK